MPERETRLNEETIKELYDTPDAVLSEQPKELEKLEIIDELAATVVAALEDKKGENIEILKVTPKTTLADIFIVASGTSGTQDRKSVV